jgi:hypothetical protein
VASDRKATGSWKQPNYATSLVGNLSLGVESSEPENKFNAQAVPKPTPNPSVELTRSGRPRKPGLRQWNHRRIPGLRGLPERAAHLER